MTQPATITTEAGHPHSHNLHHLSRGTAALLRFSRSTAVLPVVCCGHTGTTRAEGGSPRLTAAQRTRGPAPLPALHPPGPP